MQKEEIDAMIRERMSELHEMLTLSFKQELCRALDNLRGIHDRVDLDGIKYFRSAQVCALLGISESTLYRMRRANQIGFVVKNGTYYYSAGDVSRFMNRDYVSSMEDTLKKKRGKKSLLSDFV